MARPFQDNFDPPMTDRLYNENSKEIELWQGVARDRLLK
jgi:hypothetical protein